ncbi:MAG: GNAT family N-acetyltransferase [Nannocystis sp.]|nr:GNAT family N-acetyltransferase [Nannocystis sp.]
MSGDRDAAGEIRARGLAAREDLTALEATARAIFGEGERRPGWLARKIRREAVVPGLSVIVFEVGRPEVVIGYALVGQPVSLPGVARTAGVGVLPGWRGRGVGRLLIAEVRRLAAAAGLAGLEVLADGRSRGFFAGLGLRERAASWTLLAAGLGLHAGPRGRARAWEQAGMSAFSEWLAEAWTGTPEGSRWSLAIGGGAGGVAHVSAEGRAWLVQRLLLPPRASGAAAVVRAAAAVRAYAPRGAPTLLYGCPAGAPATAALLRGGWSRVQEGFVMRAELGDDL